MIYREKLYISSDEMDIIMNAFRVNGFISEIDELVDTVTFSNGYEMDIKFCGGYDDCAWMETVLYDDMGNIVADRDTYSEYTGLFKIRDEEHDDTYIVSLKTIDPINGGEDELDI